MWICTNFTNTFTILQTLTSTKSIQICMIWTFLTSIYSLHIYMCLYCIFTHLYLYTPTCIYTHKQKDTGFYILVFVIQELEDQVECMRMKDETLNSSLHFMQQEQSQLTEENNVSSVYRVSQWKKIT